MSLGKIVQQAIKSANAKLTNDGALSVRSGEYTGRCPHAKKIVRDTKTDGSVDWTSNAEMSAEEWNSLRSSVDWYMKLWEKQDKTFCSQVAYAGRATKWTKRTRKTFKFICENPVQLQFVKNMFDASAAEDRGEIECTVYCLPGLTKEPTVALNFSENTIIISGTSYLGEIKKSVFTYMNYILTDVGILPMHCSVNVDLEHKRPAIFFGLSGTGKTTLSSSHDRVLIGDDEHAWIPGVIFNMESGCYAKTANLTPETEPEIFKAANKFGSIFENVVLKDGSPVFSDLSITKNGRVSYPLSHLDQYVPEGFVFENPENIIMLTCDAFGVLPPVSKLTLEKAKEMFLVGYTSKVAGTESGITEPQAVFSPCFGAPFLPRKPSVYGDLLEEYVCSHEVDCWLVNTGWTGGGYGSGERMSLDHTRKIVESILSGNLKHARFYTHEQTKFLVPSSIPGNPGIQTFPEKTWPDLNDYEATASDLMMQIEEKINSL